MEGLQINLHDSAVQLFTAPISLEEVLYATAFIFFVLFFKILYLFAASNESITHL